MKMVAINAKSETVQVVSEKEARKVLGAGPFEVLPLPNGDKMKVRKCGDDQKSFTIGNSKAIRGNAVVIVRSSVNLSNISEMLKALRMMISFNAPNDASGLTTERELQMELWPIN